MASTDQGSSIQVVVRLRPLNNREKKKGTVPVVTCSTEKKEVTIVKGIGRMAAKHKFHFDNVFGSFATQQEIFDQTLSPIVSDVLNGFESCVFAYGQTGTGKTYTMEGNIDSDDQRGVIPRATKAIFEALSDDKYAEFSAKISYLEIYNEELTDLLTPIGTKSRIQICSSGSDKDRQTVCVGLSEEAVSSSEEVLDTIRKAQQKRQVAETKMNHASSRSHCLFTLTIESKEKVEEGLIHRTGKLHLCDLAGSESAKASDGNETRLRESMNINKSLLTLARVITAVKNEESRVPYRDSKLTRLLQSALGGACKTCIIATVSPSFLCAEETLSTLLYADRAHGIKNKPIRQAVRMAMVTPGSPQPARSSSHTSGDDMTETRTFKEMEMKLQYMESQCEEAQAALGRKHMLLQNATNRAQEAEQKLVDAEEAQLALQAQLDESAKKQAELQTAVDHHVRTIEEKDFAIGVRASTERALRSEATRARATLTQSLGQTKALFGELAARVEQERERRSACVTLNDSLSSSLHALCDKLAELQTLHAAQQAKIATHNDENLASVQGAFSSIGENAKRTASEVAAQTNQVLNSIQAMRSNASRLQSEFRAAQMETTSESMEQLSVVREEGQGHLQVLENVCKQRFEQVETHASAAKVRHTNHVEAAQAASAEHCDFVATARQTAASLLTEHQKSMELLEDTTGKLLETLTGAHAKLQQEHGNAIAQLKSATEVGLDIEIESLCSHEAVVKQIKAYLVEHNLFDAQKETLSRLDRHLETVRANKEKFQITSMEALGQAMATLEHGNGETAHVASLRGAKTEVHSVVQGAAADLTEQQEALAQGLAQQAQGMASERNHGATLEETSALVQSSLAAQTSTLHEQRCGLEKTLLDHDKGTIDAEHAVTLEQTKAALEQQILEQQQVMERQREKLESMVAFQKQGQEQLVTTMMRGVKDMLQKQMDAFTGQLETKVESVDADRENLVASTHAMQGEYEKRHDTAMDQVKRWGDSSRVASQGLKTATEQNLVLDKELSSFRIQFDAQSVKLSDETEAWGGINNAIGQSLSSAEKKSHELSQRMEGLADLSGNRFEQLVAESNAWGASNREVGAQLEKLAQTVSTNGDQQARALDDVRETVTKTHTENEAWGLGVSETTTQMDGLVEKLVSCQQATQVLQDELRTEAEGLAASHVQGVNNIRTHCESLEAAGERARVSRNEYGNAFVEQVQHGYQVIEDTVKQVAETSTEKWRAEVCEVEMLMSPHAEHSTQVLGQVAQTRESVDALLAGCTMMTKSLSSCLDAYVGDDESMWASNSDELGEGLNTLCGGVDTYTSELQRELADHVSTSEGFRGTAATLLDEQTMLVESRIESSSAGIQENERVVSTFFKDTLHASEVVQAVAQPERLTVSDEPLPETPSEAVLLEDFAKQAESRKNVLVEGDREILAPVENCLSNADEGGVETKKKADIKAVEKMAGAPKSRLPRLGLAAKKRQVVEKENQEE